MKKIISVFLLLTLAFSSLWADYALEFDGTNDYVTANEVSAALSLLQTFTLETWVYPKAGSGNDFLITFHTSAGSNIFLLGLSDLKPFVSQSLPSETGSPLPLNTWSHIAVSYDNWAHTARIYVNGLYETQTTISGSTAWPQSNGKFSLAQDWDDASATDFYEGQMDEVRVWNTIRTQAEIKNNMYTKLTGSESGLLAYYAMNTISGNTLVDGGPNAYDGILCNAPQYVSPDVLESMENSLTFDGNEQYVQLSSAMDIANGSNTVEVWVKVPEIGNNNLNEGERVGVIFGNWNIDGARNNFNTEIFSSGEVRYFWRGGDLNLFGTRDLRDGKWHHLAFVRDKENDRLRVYIDGEIELEHIGSGLDFTIVEPHRIGIDNRDYLTNNPYFHGEIDEVRVWNVARTQDQIREFMCENVKSESNLYAYYRMTDGAGENLSDNSNGSITGTLMNMSNANWVSDYLQPEGDGNITPYQIQTLNHLYWMSNNQETWGSDFEQIASIDANAVQNWNGNEGWSPAGNSTTKFTGTYNGQGFSVNHIKIAQSGSDYQGFFGYVYSGTVKDLGMKNVNITGKNYTGSLVGYHEAGTVENCYASGNITSFGSNSGGVTGYNYNSTVSCCYNEAYVFAVNSGVGGISGNNYNSTIINCYNMGRVKATSTAGGIAGTNDGSSTIRYCYNTRNVQQSSTGALVSWNAASVENCFWNSDSMTNPFNFNLGTASNCEGKTTNELKTEMVYLNAGWDFEMESDNGSNDYWDIEADGEYPSLVWEDGIETALPIELSIMTLNEVKGQVQIEWETASETENLGFILQRSIGHSEEWEEIASYQTDSSLVGHGSCTKSHQYRYVDNNVIPCQTYLYKLGDVDYSGRISWHEAVTISLNEEDNDLPDEFGLQVAYPNPFNPTLTIRYGLTEDAQTKVNIYDLRGKIIATLENKFQKAGHHELQWQARDNASGVYFVEVMSGEKNDFRKVLLVK